MVISLTQSYSAACKILCSTNLLPDPPHPLVKPTFLSQCYVYFEQFELFKFILEQSQVCFYMSTNLVTQFSTMKQKILYAFKLILAQSNKHNHFSKSYFVCGTLLSSLQFELTGLSFIDSLLKLSYYFSYQLVKHSKTIMFIYFLYYFENSHSS